MRRFLTALLKKFPKFNEECMTAAATKLGESNGPESPCHIVLDRLAQMTPALVDAFIEKYLLHRHGIRHFWGNMPEDLKAFINVLRENAFEFSFVLVLYPLLFGFDDAEYPTFELVAKKALKDAIWETKQQAEASGFYEVEDAKRETKRQAEASGFYEEEEEEEEVAAVAAAAAAAAVVEDPDAGADAVEPGPLCFTELCAVILAIIAVFNEVERTVEKPSYKIHSTDEDDRCRNGGHPSLYGFPIEKNPAIKFIVDTINEALPPIYPSYDDSDVSDDSDFQ